MQQNIQLSLFEERLPAKPYCTNNFSEGLSIKPRVKAIKTKWLQANGPTHRYWLIFDIDRVGASIDWTERGVPPPNIVCKNPKNGHAHLLYSLETSIRTAPNGSIRALRYAASVEYALASKLGADRGYSGLICKNPMHANWVVTSFRDESYDLLELAQWFEFEELDPRRRAKEKAVNDSDYGMGRNCDLFDQLRTWAYKAIRQGWPCYEQWYEACLSRVQMYNASVKPPLEYNELRGIAKSVARWTHQRYTEAGFINWQTVQGKKGGKAKGKAYEDKRKHAVILSERGISNKDIAEVLGVHRNTVRNYLMHK